MPLLQVSDFAQRFFGQGHHAAVWREVGIVVRHDKKPLAFVRAPAPIYSKISGIGVAPIGRQSASRQCLPTITLLHRATSPVHCPIWLYARPG